MSINIKLKNQDGIILKTENKICEEDIIVTPELATITEPYIPSGETQTISVPDGYAGIRECTIAPISSGGTLETIDTIVPSVEEQIIVPSDGYAGISPVSVAAVDSSIDANIIADNIKEYVDILGVKGTYGSEFSPYGRVGSLTTTQQIVTNLGDDCTWFRLGGISDYQLSGNFTTYLVPENIKKGITILGVTGTYEGGEGYDLTITTSDADATVVITYVDNTTQTVTAFNGFSETYTNVKSYQITSTNIIHDSHDRISHTEDDSGVLGKNTSLKIYSYLSCFIEGTQITLADGSTKACEDITYDDELLVWDFYEGKFASAKPAWIKVKQITEEYNKVTFDNGAEIGFVGPSDLGYHRIFNKEAGKFTYTGSPDTPNGTTTFTSDGGWTKVINQEIIKEPVNFYNIITDKHYNLFANGILTSCRLSNKYAIEDMKYIGDLLISDEEEQAYFKKIEPLKVPEVNND